MSAPTEWTLPELPIPDRTMWQYGEKIEHFTAPQMTAYALQAVHSFAEAALSMADAKPRSEAVSDEAEAVALGMLARQHGTCDPDATITLTGAELAQLLKRAALYGMEGDHGQ